MFVVCHHEDIATSPFWKWTTHMTSPFVRKNPHDVSSRFPPCHQIICPLCVLAIICCHLRVSSLSGLCSVCHQVCSLSPTQVAFVDIFTQAVCLYPHGMCVPGPTLWSPVWLLPTCSMFMVTQHFRCRDKNHCESNAMKKVLISREKKVNMQGKKNWR